MKDLRVELKVCEGCGALFIRAAEPLVERRGVYCRMCAGKLAQLPAVRSRRGKVRSTVCVGGGR